jgi:Tol biopolymer transport system component
MSRSLTAAFVSLGVLAVCVAPTPARPRVAARGAILFVGGPGSLDAEGRPVQPGLYAVDAHGGRLKELVAGGVVTAHWSPDGRLLAFTDLDYTDIPKLYVVNAGGGAPRVLARTNEFAWSPDSRKIAYLDATGSISVIRVEGRGQSRLTANGGRPLTWSADGKKLAFVRDEGLYVVNADGTGRRNLTPGVRVFGRPSWSPDSRRLAFYPCCLKGFSIVDASGAHLRTLVGRGVLLPSWSHDGKWIALGGEIPKGSDAERSGTFLIKPDGSRFHRISARGGNPFIPAWSPDSRALAVEGACCASADLWTFEIDGRHQRRLTQGSRYGYSAYSPEWQPRGRPTATLGGRYVSPAYPTDSVLDGEVVKTTRPVVRLVADGSQVLYATKDWCEVADPQAASVVRAQFCNAGVAPTGTYAHGFAGGRLAWVSMSYFMQGDNWSYETSTVEAPRAEAVTFPNGDSHPRNVPVSGIAGDGPLLVFSTWGPCRITYDPCAREPKRNGVLWKIDAARAVQIAAGPAAMTPLAVDAGRILVDHENRMLEILREDGSSLLTVPYAQGSFLGAKLEGRDLVVLTSGTVEDYDAETGIRLHEWPAAAGGARLDDVQSGIAVYVAGQYVYLVRLSDGRTVALPPRGSNPLAQLEAAGLFYAYGVEEAKYPGRVAFIPFGELPLH